MGRTRGARVKGLRLKHFKAFESAQLSIGKLCILVGKNGSGKSTLLEGFNFVAEAIRDSLRNALDRRDGLEGIRTFKPGKGKKSHISVAVILELLGHPALYGFTLGGKTGGFGYEVKEEVFRYKSGEANLQRNRYSLDTGKVKVSPVLDPESLVLPVVASENKFWQMTVSALRTMRIFTLSPEAIGRAVGIGRESYLKRDGGNAGDALNNLERRNDGEKAIRWIVDHLAEITPGVTDVRSYASGGRRGIQFLQKTKGGEVWFPAGDMSDGTLRSFGVLLALQQNGKTSLIAIDEIEDSIHPAALGVLLDAISTVNLKRPVLVSTHSPEVLVHPSAKGESVRILQWEKGVSHIYHLKHELIESLRPPMTVGALLRTNALWPADKPSTPSGHFFEVPIECD